MLVNVCDLEPVLQIQSTLYWTSWSGSSDPFILSPNVVEEMPWEMALFLATSWSKRIYSFKEEINLAFGCMFFIEINFICIRWQIQICWLNEESSDIYSKMCVHFLKSSLMEISDAISILQLHTFCTEMPLSLFPLNQLYYWNTATELPPFFHLLKFP